MTDRSYSRPWYSISNVVLLIDSDLVIVAGPQNGSKCLGLRLALRASPSEGGLKKLTLSLVCIVWWIDRLRLISQRFQLIHVVDSGLECPGRCGYRGQVLRVYVLG